MLDSVRLFGSTHFIPFISRQQGNSCEMSTSDQVQKQLHDMAERLEKYERLLGESAEREKGALRKLQLAEERLAEARPESASLESSNHVTSGRESVRRSEEHRDMSALYLSTRKLERFKDRPKQSSDITVQDWISDVRAHLDSRPLTSGQRAAIVMENLGGRARQEVQGRGAKVTNDLDAIFRVLTKVFGDGDSIGPLRSKFYGYRQKTDDDVLNCSLELVALQNRLEELDSSLERDRNKILKERLAEAVRDDGLRREMRRINVESPELDFFEMRDRVLQWAGDMTQLPTKRAAFNQECPVTMEQPTPWSVLQEHGKLLQNLIQEVKDMKVNNQRNGQQPGQDRRPNNRGYRRSCYICGSFDHLKPDCPDNTRNKSKPKQSGQQGNNQQPQQTQNSQAAQVETVEASQSSGN